ncbi:MAG: YbaB/EbfC family nucleoid-associated protein [Candidatus Sumerlaeaceae bacterium]|nr:YbaB/EbfC family nucleoid-associated protein [Candidatus Sumerlaeaceae bacterium]
MFDLRQIQKMQKELQERMEKVREELKQKTVEASSGGGMVTAIANGNQEIVAVKIKKEAIDEDDVEMLEDLVVAAVNLALEKSKELNEQELSKLTGGLKIPGLF